jgi:hypothetical protein
VDNRFDGDQLNGTLSLDHWTTEELRALAPHKSVFDLNAPRQVSKNLSMPKPVVATIANGIHSPEPHDAAKQQRMAQLPEYTGSSPVVENTEVVNVVPSISSQRRRAVDRTSRSTDKDKS